MMEGSAVVQTPLPASRWDELGRSVGLGWVGENATKGWKVHDHPPKKGIKPLVVFGE